MKILNKKF